MKSYIRLPETKTFFFSTLLLITAMIWGMGFIIVKQSLDYMPSIYILAFRFTLGCFGMTLLSIRQLRSITKRTIGYGMILGVCMFLAFFFQTEAVRYTSVSNNAFLTTAYVVFVPMISFVMYKKTCNIQTVIATILCFAGIGLLSLDSNLTVNLGDVLTLICALFFALHIVCSSHFFEQGYSPIVLNTLQLGFSALFAWLFASFQEPLPANPINEHTLVGILYLGICCTMLAFLFQAIGQKHTSATVASILLSTESVFGVLFSILFLNESMTLRMWIGCSVLFAAVILSQVDIQPLIKQFQSSK